MNNINYKVVDAFNGAVIDYCATKEQGERIAERAAQEKQSFIGMQNVICMYEVVPSTYTWGWDERANKFIWSE